MAGDLSNIIGKDNNKINVMTNPEKDPTYWN
jgi:hypothetical protein